MRLLPGNGAGSLTVPVCPLGRERPLGLGGPASGSLRMSGRPLPPLWLFVLLSLAARPRLSALGLSGAERVTSEIGEPSGRQAQPAGRAQAQAVLAAAVRAKVLGQGKMVTTSAILSHALDMLPKVSDILASLKPTLPPDPVPMPISRPAKRTSHSLPPPVATRAPILPPELTLTLQPVIFTPFSALTAFQTRAASSLVFTPAPLAPQTPATSLVPVSASTVLQTSATSLGPTSASTVLQTPTTSLVSTSASTVSQTPATALVPASVSTLPQTPATSLVPALASTVPHTSAEISVGVQDSITLQIAASLVPDQALMSFLISSLVPTQTLTPSPSSLHTTLVPIQTFQLIQPLTPSLISIQTSVSFLPLATFKKYPYTPPTLLPVLPQNLTVNLMPTQVSKLSRASAAPVMYPAAPTLTLPVIPQTIAVLLVPAQILLSSQTLVPAVEHIQIPTPLLPLSLISDKAPSPPPQASVPTRTLIQPPIPQTQSQILISTPKFTVPLSPIPKPPPKATKLCCSTPKMTKVLLPTPELKHVPVQSPITHLNNFPSPSVFMVSRYQAHTTKPSSLVLQKSFQKTNSLCLGPCTCKAGKLSCTGLSPEHRLHSVPGPGPKAPNITFFYLDFHGNSISIIERGIWKSYPWAETLNLTDNALYKLHKNSFEGLLSLQYLNLGFNLLKKLSYGTFQAWHGMQFFQKLILHNNPLSDIEDSFFFQLPSLKYLDIGRTKVSLIAIENILMMSLRLQTLILPSNVTCCLCQFKKNIESTFKTIKLHCESKCFTNSSICDQKKSIGDIKEEFINTLQTRKKEASIELSLQPERIYVDSDNNTLTLLSEQLSSNGEIDLLKATKYLFSKLLKSQIKNVKLKLFPFIKLLGTCLQNGEKTKGPSTTKTSWFSFGPIWINLTDEIQLRKLYIVTHLLEAYLQQKTYYNNNKYEKNVKAKYPILGRKWETFQLERSRKCDKASGKCIQLEARSPRKASASGMDACKGQFCPKMRLPEVGKVSNNGKSMNKKHSKRTGQENFQRKQESVKSSLENIAKERTKSLGQTVKRLRKPGWYHVGIPSIANPFAASLEDKSKSDSVTYPISALKSINKRLKYKIQKETDGIGTEFQKDHFPTLHSNQNHFFHKAKFPEAKQSPKIKNKFSQNRWLLENSALTDTSNLINHPFKKAISFSPERNIAAKAFKETISAMVSEGPSTRITTSQNSIASSKQKDITLDNSLPIVQQTNKTPWEYPGNAEILSEPNGNSYFNFSASADSFEIELNQRLQPLIPNNALRSLVSHVVRVLQKDCMEPRVQVACAKLISRTGALMKLLSEQEKMKQSPAHQNLSPWKNKTHLNESTTLQMVLGKLQTDKLTKDIPKFGYNSKLLLAISVTVVVMIIIAVICLIEICSHRPTTSKGEIKYSCNLWNFITSLHKKSPRKYEEDKDFYTKGKPLWLRDMYRPLDATRKKNMAQKLHDQDSSDEEENLKQRNE
ncbi:leucine-rich repeat-containing protein 37A2-like isoform X2 [Macrotis lagotis]|uniref:leucine-rich repeat-containing protein 37A2-like isoform X2 n=1 Tax=Macrotis lagotis TaxID=92651 RepID=UPI003D69F961